MRDIPAPLLTHIAGEVTSLARCLRITRTDGVVFRLTSHDDNLTVNDEEYVDAVPIQWAAIQSTDSLSVDNTEIVVGLHDDYLTRADILAGVYRDALFEIIVTNWEDTSEGSFYLKRGTFGSIEIIDDLYAKIQLRGLTYALQRPIVERYSPTCRVALGSAKCGIPNGPFRLRRPNQKVKTFDWFVVPKNNYTAVPLTNDGFNTDLAEWTQAGGSLWSVANTVTPYESTHYVVGGSPSGISGNSGRVMSLYRDVLLSGIGLASGDIDDGDYSLDVSVQVLNTSSTTSNPGKVFIEQFDSTGRTLRRDESDWVIPDYNTWQGIGVTALLVPSARTVRIGVMNRIDYGLTGGVAFDDLRLGYFSNVNTTFNSKMFRITRIPSSTRAQAAERRSLVNGTFNQSVANGTSGITSWVYGSGSYWQTVATEGAVEPVAGAYFLRGGDNGSTTPATEYTLSQTTSLVDTFGASEANLDASRFFLKLKGYANILESGSAYKVTVEFLNAANGTISSITTDYVDSSTVNEWTAFTVQGGVPTLTRSIKTTLFARSGADSDAEIGFDDISVELLLAANSSPADPSYGYLGDAEPSYDYTVGAMTVDGDAIVQARDIVFFYGTVTSEVDARTFGASGVNVADALMYSGRITWVSGANAGRSSYVRLWSNTSKQFQLYSDLPNEPSVGDIFVYAYGCDKTITRCGATFGNAVNFRGEPYLPGPAKVIQFLTSGE